MTEPHRAVPGDATPGDHARLLGAAAEPPPAFPLVGASAQVMVAEWTDPDDGHARPCHDLRAGDLVTLVEQDDENDWAVKADDGRMGLVAARHLSPVPAAGVPGHRASPEVTSVARHLISFLAWDEEGRGHTAYAHPEDMPGLMTALAAHLSEDARRALARDLAAQDGDMVVEDPVARRHRALSAEASCPDPSPEEP